jgi:hypothetical protein
MTKVVIADDYVVGQHLHELHVDDRSYGSFRDLEAINTMLASIGATDFTLTGAGRCEWLGDRLGRQAPCPKIASRTVLWSTSAEYLVWVACAPHAKTLTKRPNLKMPHCVLLEPADRLGHSSLFRKGSPADMTALRNVLAGLPVPARILDGVPA